MGNTVKRSVSFDADLDAQLSERFEAGERSRFLNEAAREALARLRMTELLDQMDAEDGGVPEDLRAEVAALPRPK